MVRMDTAVITVMLLCLANGTLYRKNQKQEEKGK